MPLGFQAGELLPCGSDANASGAHESSAGHGDEAGDGGGFQPAKKKGKQKKLKRGRQFLWRMWVKGVPQGNADVQAVLQPEAPTELWALNKYQRQELANG